jgi:hypothetical protein
MNEEGEVSRPPLRAIHHGEDREMAEIAREREAKMKREDSRRGKILVRLVVGIVATVVVVYGSSAEVRAGIARFIEEQRAPKDKSATAEVETPPDLIRVLMDTAGAHGHQIDDATRTLGVDPANVGPGDDPGMRREIEKMTGVKQPEPVVDPALIQQAARRFLDEVPAEESETPPLGAVPKSQR